MPIADIKANNFNLDIKNPNKVDEDHGDPLELLAKYIIFPLFAFRTISWGGCQENRPGGAPSGYERSTRGEKRSLDEISQDSARQSLTRHRVAERS